MNRRDLLRLGAVIGPDYIVPMHCTGMNTMMAVQAAMPKTLVMPSTGTRVVFGA